jgi:nucleotidyltransferase/DNA polymerase involved in DNA repair
METIIEQLQQIKGVGAALAKRLAETGFDTLPRLAAATEQELVGIKGLAPTSIPIILEQARALSESQQAGASEENLTQMLEDAERLRMGVSNLVLRLRDQHAESNDDKNQRALRKEITRVLATLERVEASLSEQLRRLGKKLAKADAKLAGVPHDDLAALTKGLRHTRKAIDKIVR